jgi:ABC-type phosphate transport system auxiliary subunit
MSEEDMSFLASQSALAMEGAPLAVEVRESPAGHEEDVRRLAQQAQDVETARVAAQQATVERLRVEEQLVKVQRELLSGKEDKGALEKRREEILRAYKTAYTNESDKKAEVQSKTGRVVVVWDSGGTRR